MKLKLVLPIVLAGAITYGFCGSITKIPKNVLMTEVKASDHQNKKVEDNMKGQKIDTITSKEKAVEMVTTAFDNYLGIKIDSNKLHERVDFDEIEGQKLYIVQFAEQENPNKRVSYDGIIDIETGKILYLSCLNNNTENINSLSLEEAKNIGSDFIKRSNLVGDKEINLDEKATNELLDYSGAYQYTYFKYDKNKTVLVVIDRSTEKVISFYLIDEMHARG